MMDSIIAGFKPVSLEEMDSVKLMNRIDTKFVTSNDILEKALLESIKEGYRVLEVNGNRLTTYDSIYFDTDRLDMYLMHHNGRLPRTKVRTRNYVCSGDAFLEVKKKNNHKRTKKKRVEIRPEDMSSPFGPIECQAHIHKHTKFLSSDLHPVLNTSFNRITIVNPSMTERVTIDMNLKFKNLLTGIEANFGDAVVIELKQEKSKQSSFANILRDLRVHPFRISKYCIGSAMTNPNLKQGLFKEKIRHLNKSYHATSSTSGI